MDNLNSSWAHFRLFSGTCDADTGECQCIEAELKLKHSICAGPLDDNVCSMKCQYDDKAKSGHCGGEHGWDCICEFNDGINEIAKNF